jgi:transcriptional regulator with XRE-family HTH domain
VAHPDDERLGMLLRKLRRRSGLTQERLSELSGVPVEDLSDIKSGSVGRVRVGRARSAFSAVDSRLYLNPWWHGAAADRLLDEDHALLVERASLIFKRRGWVVTPEVTFSEYGERGSIHLLAGYESNRSVAVAEIKSVIGALEETNRRLDVKVRLASAIAERVFGWSPRFVGRLLIVQDSPSVRRVIQAHSVTMDAIYPERSRAVRAWLRKPGTAIAGIWFLAVPAHSGNVATRTHP